MINWQDDIFNLYVEQKGRVGRDYTIGGKVPELQSVKKDVRTAGMSVPTRDAMLFITHLLNVVGSFDDDLATTIERTHNSKARGELLMQALNDHSEDIISKRDQISDKYQGEFTKFINRSAVNRGRGGKDSTGRKDQYQAQAAARDLAKQQKALMKQIKVSGVDTSVADSIEDAVLDSMEASRDRTLISIQVKDLDKQDKLIEVIKNIGVEEDNIGIDRMGNGNAVIDFFLPIGDPAEVQFSSMEQEDLDELFGQFSSSGVAMVEVLPPDKEIDNAISSLGDELQKNNKPTSDESDGEDEIEDIPVSNIDDMEFDPETSGDAQFADIEDTRDNEADSENTNRDDLDQGDSDESEDPDSEYDYDPMDPDGENNWEDEEDTSNATCVDCEGKGYKNYKHHGEMEFDNCRSCNGTGMPGNNHIDYRDEDQEETTDTSTEGDEAWEAVISNDNVFINVYKRFTGTEWVAVVNNRDANTVSQDINPDKETAIKNAIRDYTGMKHSTEVHSRGDEDMQMLHGESHNKNLCTKCGCDIDDPNPDCECDHKHKEESADIDTVVESRMSPQEANRWMLKQRSDRMRNNMKHDNRWGQR